MVENILEPGERLRNAWPVAGTTGYDFLNLVSGLFVDLAGEQPLTEFYGEFTGESVDYPALVRAKKHQALHELLGSDVNRLTALFIEVWERHRRHRDYTHYELNEALREVIACFPVYRTYVQAEAGHVTDDDIRYVTEAVERAKSWRPELDAALCDFLHDLLLLRVRGDLEGELVMRFQQLTGPTMAKGLEDTVFYGFNRLVALNDVGVIQGTLVSPLQHSIRLALRRNSAGLRGCSPPRLTTPSVVKTCGCAFTCCPRSPHAGPRWCGAGPR